MPLHFSCLAVLQDGQSPTLAAEQYMQRHGRPDAKTLQPVILMPGLAGSGLQAEIDKTYKPAWNCFKVTVEVRASHRTTHGGRV